MGRVEKPSNGDSIIINLYTRGVNSYASLFEISHLHSELLNIYIPSVRKPDNPFPPPQGTYAKCDLTESLTFKHEIFVNRELLNYRIFRINRAITHDGAADNPFSLVRVSFEMRISTRMSGERRFLDEIRWGCANANARHHPKAAKEPVARIRRTTKVIKLAFYLLTRAFISSSRSTRNSTRSAISRSPLAYIRASASEYNARNWRSVPI